MKYEDDSTIRKEIVDGVGNWYWPQEDTGAWGGPHKDWMQLKDKYVKYLTHKRVVIQAGGNLGLYPRLFSDFFDYVYTFEPDTRNFHYLTLNCQKDNIYKFNAALGDKHAMVQVNRISRQNYGMHKVDHVPEGTVPQLKIDDFDWQFCDMIQLDVEGYEEYILQGGIETIRKFKPLITLEKPNKQCRDILASLNYNEVDSCLSDHFFKG